MPTEGEFLEALGKRYAAPEFVLFPQVRNGTGGHGTRTASRRSC